MNIHHSIVVSLVVLLIGKSALAQYHPGEDCHTECEIIYCDYYHDYCDYDCYEVCYPYSPESPMRSSSTIKGQQYKTQQAHRSRSGKSCPAN